MTPDTAALRADIAWANAREDVCLEVGTDVLDALCDAADGRALIVAELVALVRAAGGLTKADVRGVLRRHAPEATP